MPYISNGRSWLAWSTTGAYTCEPAQAVGSRLTSPEPLFSQEDLPWAHYRDEGIVFLRHHGLLGCLFPFLSLFWKSRGCFLADHFDCNNEAKIPPKEKALLEWANPGGCWGSSHGAAVLSLSSAPDSTPGMLGASSCCYPHTRTHTCLVSCPIGE